MGLCVRVSNMVRTVANEISGLKFSWIKSLNIPKGMLGKALLSGRADAIGKIVRKNTTQSMVVQDFNEDNKTQSSVDQKCIVQKN